MALTLIHTPVAPDLAAAGRDIKDGIDAGHITGLGVFVVTKGNKFFVDVFGSPMRDPHGARGCVASLDDCLREIAHRKKNAATTL